MSADLCLLLCMCIVWGGVLIHRLTGGFVQGPLNRPVICVYQEEENMQAAENLIRKQFFIAPKQVKKVEGLARKKRVSAAAVVRMAIDAFHPDATAPVDDEELVAVVSDRLREALEETRQTRRRLQQTLRQLDRSEAVQ